MRIADVLTASRVISVPIVIWLIFSNEMLAAYYLFTAAAITDLLDGYFARRSKKIATYGETFDGLADFVLVYGTIVALFIRGEGFWLFVVALILLAFTVAIIGLITIKRGRFSIPHLDTNLLAAFVYPTVMAYIIGWRYAEILLVVTFIWGLYTAINYSIYIRSIHKSA